MNVEHSGPSGKNSFLCDKTVTADVDRVFVAVVVATFCRDIPCLEVVVLDCRVRIFTAKRTKESGC